MSTERSVHINGTTEQIEAAKELVNEVISGKQSISTGNGNAAAEGKQNKCSTYNAFVGDSKQYRDHFKSEWHKHNLKRKTRQPLPKKSVRLTWKLTTTKPI